jgi:hypothetical protein
LPSVSELIGTQVPLLSQHPLQFAELQVCGGGAVSSPQPTAPTSSTAHTLPNTPSLEILIVRPR